MSVNSALRDEHIRHALHVQKFGRGEAEKIVKLLNASDEALMETIAKRVAMIEERGYDRGPTTTKRLQALRLETKAINDSVYKKVADGLQPDLEELAIYEAEWARATLSNALPVNLDLNLPTATFLKTLVTESPIDGHLLGSWVSKMSDARQARVEQAIMIGLTQGQTTDQIVTAIRGSRAKQYADGILQISRQSAQTLVLTATATVASEAREETYKSNSHVIKSVQNLATLDLRTSSKCQSLDGKVYPIDEPHPKPPFHPRCRTVQIPVTKSFRELGVDRDEVSARNRASMDGQVPGTTTLEPWARSQSPERQAEIFNSAERARMFREREVPFAQLYREDGSYRSIAELRQFGGDGRSIASTPPVEPVAQPAFDPINPRTTDATIVVIPRLQAQKSLDAMLAVGATDVRHETKAEFKGTVGKGWGKSTFPKEASDEAASMILAIHPELDAMADRFGIPRLRAYRAISGARTMGNMGDASMGVNFTYFNAWASKVGGGDADSVIKALVADRDAIHAELEAMRTKIDEIKAELKRIGTSDPRWVDVYDDYSDQAKAYNARIKAFNAAAKKAQAAQRKGQDTSSTWRPGDDVAKRPYNAADYFTGIDRARNVLYHEFAHHLHQAWKKEGRRSRANLPPLEIELGRVWAKKFHGVTADHIAARAAQASTYSTVDPHEWFAENFSLIMMGRRDLADADAINIIERLLNDRD